MEYLTLPESVKFIDGLQRQINISHSLNYLQPELKQYTFKYPLAQDLFKYSYSIAAHCINDSWGFLLITHDNVYPSSVNSHLYYSLRRHYGDARSIHSAPGHLFFKHEKHDLASFISVAIMNLYDCIILSDDDVYRFRLSNDEHLDIFTDKDNKIDWI